VRDVCWATVLVLWLVVCGFAVRGFAVQPVAAATQLLYYGSDVDGCVQCLYVQPQSMADTKAHSSQFRSL
jgi:hypothetical protein